MSGIVGQIIYALLKFFIPWLQSGSTETTTVSGELSPEKLVGVDDLKLRPSELPNFLVVMALLLFVCGCAGEKHTISIVEPGATSRIVGEEKVTSVVTDDKGNQAVVKRPLTGGVTMPLSVYRRLRNAYIELQKIKQAEGLSLPPLDSMTPEELEELVKKGKPVPQEMKVK